MIQTTTLPPLEQQAQRLIDLEVHVVAGLDADEVLQAAVTAPPGVLLVLRPDLVPASALAPLVEHRGNRGFVVTDMVDVDDFEQIADLSLPASPVYGLEHVDRGDAMASWSPAEALPAILADGRTPLTLSEGLCWLLQVPSALERNHCFMTIGSRRRQTTGKLDARTPAIWISNGTGRDGRARRHAPKVGWCWAGNRHTWLGFASAAARVPLAI